jgi:hypothetical protein
MKTFITIKDGFIDDITQTDESPGNAWTEVPNSFSGNHGDKADWFDANWLRIPDDELVTQGKRIDKRGIWYNKETREEKQVIELDEEFEDEENWTLKKPLENETYQKWDEQENEWVVDTDKKERAEKEAALAKVKMRIEDAEKRIIRPLRAINRNRATQDDLDTFDEYDTLIENELRPELNRLETELKTA